MKYEDWIRYEQQREKQPEVFAWVSLPLRPPRPRFSINNSIKTQERGKMVRGLLKCSVLYTNKFGGA
ncbi:MAG: hypothetical protein ABFS17_03285 [Chloroflexota bacterium]